MSLSKIEVIQESLSATLHDYTMSFDDYDPDELIQAVLDTLDDHLTDMSVIWARTVVTEEGYLFAPRVFKTNE